MTTLELILASSGLSALAIPPTLYQSMDDDAVSVLSSAEARIIGAALSHLTAETKRNADAVVAINESLHILTRLEVTSVEIGERLKEGSMRMTDHEKRLQLLEQQINPLLETRKWVITGVLAGIGMIGIALVKLVIIDPARVPYPYVPPAPAQHQREP